MNNDVNRLKFYSEIEEALRVFNRIDYSVITGGFAQNPSKSSSDVDIITVIPFYGGNLKEQIFSFAKSHINAQICNGFIPDSLFPTDVVTREQILDAVNGRAFAKAVHEDFKLIKLSEDEVKNNPESDYRIWLYEMISHNFDIIGGSYDLLINDTSVALKTIWLYTVHLNNYKREVSLDKVRYDLFKSAGLSYYLNEKQCRCFLRMLKHCNMGNIVGEGIIRLNDDIISEEIVKFKENVGNGFRSTHFFEWDELRKSISLTI